MREMNSIVIDIGITPDNLINGAGKKAWINHVKLREGRRFHISLLLYKKIQYACDNDMIRLDIFEKTDLIGPLWDEHDAYQIQMMLTLDLLSINIYFNGVNLTMEN